VGVLDLTQSILSRFGFKEYEVMLSTRPEKSVGSDEIWENSTDALQIALLSNGWAYSIDDGGGAFHGPKIDINIMDTAGRLWQCSTIQCDFNLPDRFQLQYVDSDGSRQRPIMVHRAFFGTLERFFAILVESYAGEFPLWLAPTKMKLLPVTDDARNFCHDVAMRGRTMGLKIQVDRSGERLGKWFEMPKLNAYP
jgi:threonyl-tRNA synthetase